MKKKEEVFVHVKNLDESRELLKVLKEAGERVYRTTETGLKTGIDDDGDSQFDYPYVHYDGDDWRGHVFIPGKKPVTVSELRRILSGDTLNTDIAKLKDKYPDYCFTIIVDKR